MQIIQKQLSRLINITKTKINLALLKEKKYLKNIENLKRRLKLLEEELNKENSFVFDMSAFYLSHQKKKKSFISEIETINSQLLEHKKYIQNLHFDERKYNVLLEKIHKKANYKLEKIHDQNMTELWNIKNL